MNTGLVMVGRADAGLMVYEPPVMLNLMTEPSPMFACWMAERRVQLVEPGTVPSSQTPSLVSLSAPSPVESMVYVTGNSDMRSTENVVDDAAMDSMAARASALP